MACRGKGQKEFSVFATDKGHGLNRSSAEYPKMRGFIILDHVNRKRLFLSLKCRSTLAH
ncbi:hypothetical protein RUM43_009605, partial [Polyplax serrata]